MFVGRLHFYFPPVSFTSEGEPEKRTLVMVELLFERPVPQAVNGKPPAPSPPPLLRVTLPHPTAQLRESDLVWNLHTCLLDAPQEINKLLQPHHPARDDAGRFLFVLDSRELADVDLRQECSPQDLAKLGVMVQTIANQLEAKLVGCSRLAGGFKPSAVQPEPSDTKKPAAKKSPAKKKKK